MKTSSFLGCFSILHVVSLFETLYPRNTSLYHFPLIFSARLKSLCIKNSAHGNRQFPIRIFQRAEQLPLHFSTDLKCFLRGFQRFLHLMQSALEIHFHQIILQEYWNNNLAIVNHTHSRRSHIFRDQIRRSVAKVLHPCIPFFDVMVSWWSRLNKHKSQASIHDAIETVAAKILEVSVYQVTVFGPRLVTNKSYVHPLFLPVMYVSKANSHRRQFASLWWIII